MVFVSHVGKILEWYFKLSHDRILPYNFKFNNNNNKVICLERLRKTTENLKFSSVSADNGCGYLQNTSYRHTKLLGVMWSCLLHFIGQSKYHLRTCDIGFLLRSI